MGELNSLNPQIICGDFNADPSTDSGCDRFEQLSTLMDVGGLLHFDIGEPTFCKGPILSTPDAMFVQPKLHAMSHLELLPQGSADHHPLLWQFGHASSHGSIRKKRRWKLNGADFKAFRDLLVKEASCHADSFHTGDALADYRAFTQLLLKVAKRTLPFHASAKGPRPTQWSSQAQVLASRCDELYRQHKLDATPEVATQLSQAKQALSKQLKGDKNVAWRHFTSGLSLDGRNGTHSAYRLLSSLSGKVAK
eukprot:6472976-Amphidinium_carterae.1